MTGRANPPNPPKPSDPDLDTRLDRVMTAVRKAAADTDHEIHVLGVLTTMGVVADADDKDLLVKLLACALLEACGFDMHTIGTAIIDVAREFKAYMADRENMH